MVIAVGSPLLVGIYKESLLIDKIETDEKTSEALPLLFENVFKRFEVSSLYYAKGPGSFMAIKISYIFLKTLSIAKNIPLFGADAFNFNQNSPIKAVKSLYFVKENGIIRTKKLDAKESVNFKLPEILDKSVFSLECEPLYILPAV